LLTHTFKETARRDTQPFAYIGSTHHPLGLSYCQIASIMVPTLGIAVARCGLGFGGGAVAQLGRRVVRLLVSSVRDRGLVSLALACRGLVPCRGLLLVSRGRLLVAGLLLEVAGLLVVVEGRLLLLLGACVVVGGWTGRLGVVRAALLELWTCSVAPLRTRGESSLGSGAVACLRSGAVAPRRTDAVPRLHARLWGGQLSMYMDTQLTKESVI
jgi:hypothetical protein